MYPNNESNNWSNQYGVYEQDLGIPNFDLDYSNLAELAPVQNAPAHDGQYYQNSYFNSNLTHSDDVNTYQNQNFNDANYGVVPLHQNNDVYNNQHLNENPRTLNSRDVNVHQNQNLDPNSIPLYPDSGFPKNHDDETSPNTKDFFKYYDDDVRYSGVPNQMKYESPDSELDSEDHVKNSHQIQKPRGQSKVQKSDSGASSSSTVEIPDYIDTKKLGEDILVELETHEISQTLFAKKIIGRSQGTLSELLRKPKRWEDMKMSGQSTYVKLWQWMEQPLERRMEILEQDSEENQSRKRRNPSTSAAPAPKKARIVFSEIQKRTLNAIFKEKPHPSVEDMHNVGRHLKLEYTTVSNFFMNARRRRRHAESQSN